jgi:diguanylate cyclase (GGDEF)-like protein
MLEKLAYPRSPATPRVLTLALWALYLLVFGLFQRQVGPDLIALAIFPVIGAGWYFGFGAGVLLAGLTIVANLFLLSVQDHLAIQSAFNLGDWLDGFTLLIVGAVVGRLGTVVQQRRATLIQLQELEKEQAVQAEFLSALNDIVSAALETDDMQSTLRILVKRMGQLFSADDCTVSLWDEASESPIPIMAYGPASEAFPSIRFEPGEVNLAAVILNSGKSLVIPDLAHSSYQGKVSPKVLAALQIRSLIGLPLATRDRKLGAMFLNYRAPRQFRDREIEHAELAARQISLMLTRMQLFEDANQRVKELAVLNEITVASTKEANEDRLLEAVTEIIARNLFPDNFGVILLDANSGLLHAHSSYRAGQIDYDYGMTVPLGNGVTGQVAQSGISQRIGDVRLIENYLDVDKNTRSELCVPLKVGQRILGVINAESMKIDAFTAGDEKLMITIAGQLATTLEYLRSLEAERLWMNTLAHTNELVSALLHITSHIERILSPTEVIKTLKDEFEKMGLTCLLVLYLRESGQMVIQYTSLLASAGESIGNDVFGYRLRSEKMESLFGIQNVMAPVVLPAPLDAMKIILGALSPAVMANTLSVIGITARTEIIHLPLLFEDRLLGALWLWGKNLTRADLPIMSIFARQIAITLENARLFEETQNLALTDPLTDLYNRRGLFELGRVEFLRAERQGRPFSGIMIDLDHFKKVNDTYGHYAGDQVLQEFAKRCKNCVRDIDFVGRYGGEEIVILLPETDFESSLQVAGRVHAAISNVPMSLAGGLELKVTASLGVAKLDENTHNLETLIARADQALYIAKHRGRNQVATSV